MANFRIGNLQPTPSGQTRIQMARSLMGAGASGAPVQSLTQGLNRLAQGFLGGRLSRIEQEEQERRQQEFTDTLRNALASRTGGQPGSAQLGPPDPQQLSQALLSNPDTAPMGAQIGLSQALQGPQSRTQTISGERANQMFGTNLPPGAAVTVESGPQGMSIAGVESPQESKTSEAFRAIVKGREGPVTVLRDNMGLYLQEVDDQGNPVKKYVDSGDIQEISGREEGTPGSFSGDKVKIRNFQKLERSLPVVNRLQQRIREGLESGEFVGGISGGTLKMFNSFRNQVSQMYSAFNQDKPADQRDVELSVDKFRDSLGGVTDMSTQVQSAVLDLAYMTLKAKGEERVSDQDIRNELNTFALDTNDPNAIMNRVNDKIGDLYTNYQTFAQQLDQEPMFQFDPQRGQPEGGASISPEDEALINKYLRQ